MISLKRNETYVDEAKVRALFEKYDKNKNGILEKKEFVKLMYDVLKDLDENLSKKKVQEASEEGFKKFDLDHNKEIEFSEFYDFIKFLVSEKGYEL